jgi:DNA-binding MarR family transcriptional regulator
VVDETSPPSSEPGGFPTLQEVAFLALQRAAGRLHLALRRRLEPSGLTPTQYNLLRVLRAGRRRGFTTGELGERLIARGPDVTRLVTRMRNMGLVEQRRDPNDGRIHRVFLSNEGTELLSRLDAPVERWMRGFARRLGDEELRELIRLAEGFSREAEW